MKDQGFTSQINEGSRCIPAHIIEGSMYIPAQMNEGLRCIPAHIIKRSRCIPAQMNEGSRIKNLLRADCLNLD